MGFKGWQKITIYDDAGNPVSAKAPIIISASRSTDIPAFYSNWFFNRMQKGYVVWENPFNGKPSYISFSNTRLIVFWSKNPRPIIPYLKYLDEKKIGYYFHFTLNDYEKEKLEPNVPPTKERINTFIELAEKIGKEKVIWRWDPLIKTDHLDSSELLDRIFNIGEQLKKHTNKLVFSFIQISPYKKVQNNLRKYNSHFSSPKPSDYEFTPSQKHEFGEKIQGITKGWNIEVASCAEPTDLSEYKIKHNKCIDDELIRKIYPHDKKLMHFLNTGETIVKQESNHSVNPNLLTPVLLKDKGQRKYCKCIYSKDIGQYNTCLHFCSYCYANSNIKTTRRNYHKHEENSESIINKE